MSEAQNDIALIGLAVMGQNLVLNMNDNGYNVAVYNRTSETTDSFIKGPAKGTQVQGFHNLEKLIKSLKRPRKVTILVKAGPAVDSVIAQIKPLLEKGDVIIDLGNSHWPDTERRAKELKKEGFLFVGSGISGGEEGARHGPSMMPGGHPEAWPLVKEIFQAVAAKVDGEPCCEWVGEGGAGHYVKMVHNGIEYGDMQLICEAYQLMEEYLGLNEDQMADIFNQWNGEELDSYLIEITAKILAYKDEDGLPLVRKVMDRAGQKGTGKWTVDSCLELSIPVTLIGEAVFSRCLSSLKEERVIAAETLKGPEQTNASEFGKSMQFVPMIKEALYASKIISYAQGYMLLREAAKEHNWNLNYGGIALMWRGGCIIRSRFLSDIKVAFDKNPELQNLLLDSFFQKEIQRCSLSWRKVIAEATLNGIPVPAFSTALAFFDGYRRARLPANLLQAQRDFFGAHTYERVDKPKGEWFHTDWIGAGMNVRSGSYEA